MATEKQVIGRYRVLERVGRGSMGVIYRGLDPVLDREVAIKVMSADFALEGEEAKRRFFREARAAAKLQHRNVVTIFEFDEEDGVPYIVMEFLRGRNLAERLNIDPPLTIEQKLDILIELCDGLQYAGENGVIHRDVKPANVWLLDDGSVKLVDFGIAKIVTSTSTLGKDVIGSAAYMSPEQAEGQTVDARTDIFSAAVVLYELIAGKRPFEASTPTATLLKIVQEAPPPITAPDAPPALVAVIEHALAKKPADRYQTAAELGGELRAIRSALSTGSDLLLSGDSLTSTTTTRRVQESSGAATATDVGARSRSQRHRWPWLLFAGVVGGLVMTALLYWANLQKINQPAQQQAEGGAASATGAPATPAPALVLRVHSVPEGAAITVDGVAKGIQTPAELSLAGGVPKSIKLTRDGFKPYTALIAQADLQRGTVTYQLVAEGPMYVTVKPSGSYPFEIWSPGPGGKLLSGPSVDHRELTLQVGQKIRLLASRQFLDREFPISANQRTLSPPEVGIVRFRADGRDDCILMQDGQEYRGTKRSPPLTLPEVAAGVHVFEFKCGNDGVKLSVSLTVVAGIENAGTVK